MNYNEYTFASKLKSARGLINSSFDCEEFKKLDKRIQRVLKDISLQLFAVCLAYSAGKSVSMDLHIPEELHK